MPQNYGLWLGIGLTCWLLYLLSPMLTPFVAAILLAYLTDPWVNRLESFGLGRSHAVIAVFLGLAFIFALAIFFIVPMLEYQIDRLPVYGAWVKSTAAPWLKLRFGIRLKLSSLDQISQLLGQNWQQAGGVVAGLFTSLSHSGSVLLTWAMNLLLIPVVMFYVLRDWNALIAKIHDFLPRPYVGSVTRLALEVDEILGVFLRGQFLVMLSLGAFYSIGLWWVDLDLALLIGMLAGLLSFIPYLGVIIGILFGSIAALTQFESVWSILPVVAVFGLGQVLDAVFLTPKLVGGRIGLHPVAIIFAVMAGGQLFGFLGVLLALPAASVISVLLRSVTGIYKASVLYGDTL